MINIKKEYKTFEDIKHINENGVEYWEARELKIVLQYARWEKFLNVIEKAKKLVKIVVMLLMNIFSKWGSCQNVLIMLV